MTARQISWRSFLAPERVILATVVALLFWGFTLGGHSRDVSGVSRADGTSGTRGAQTQTWGNSKDSDIRRDGSKPDLAIEAVRPISAASGEIPAREDLAHDTIQVRLGDLVAYSGNGLGNESSTLSTRSFTPTGTPTKVPTFATGTPTPTSQSSSSGRTRAGSLLGTGLVMSDKVYEPVQDGPTTEPEQPPTAPPLDNITPLIPNSTPTIYVTNVDGRFYWGGSYTFNVATQTPPAFTQQFPLINFNPPAGYSCNGTPIDENTRPLTDVDEHNPCALIVAQATAPAPTPTLLQAGIAPLEGYQDVFLTNLYVSEAADITFNLHSDDGFIWGVGPLNGVPGNPQPYSLPGGVFTPAPPPSPTPYPTTTFGNYTVVAQRNAGSPIWGGGSVTVRFPVAGFYPIEIDNAEDDAGGLNITLESPLNTPVLNGPSPTPTNTPSAQCESSSDWCTQISPNSGIGHNELRGVAVIAQDDIWAVGGYDITDQGGHSLVQHWDNTQWSIVSSPDVGPLNGVAFVSANDIWAVGDNGIIHYDGTSWTQQTGQAGAKSVAARNANDVWVVGTDIRHWTGSWGASTPVPDSGTLTGVAAVTSSIAWAVGYTGNGYPDRRPLIVRWNGSTWSTFTSPSFSTDSYLTSIDFYGTQTPEPGNDHALDHMWAVGTQYDQHDGVDETLTEFWNLGSGPGQWRIVDSPNPGDIDSRLNHVWLNGEGDVWAVGSYWPSGASGNKTLIMRWNDTAWAQVDSPAPGVSSNLLGIATIPGNAAVVTTTWAVGSYLVETYGASRTLVESIQAIQDPATTVSLYENNLDAGTLHKYYTQGCAAAARRTSGVIVLDFGQPQNLGSAANPQYGTQLTGPTQQPAYIKNPTPSPTGTPVIPVDIKHAVEQFGKGYHDAYSAAVPIPDCPYVSGPVHSIVLAVGINNDLNPTAVPTILPTPTIEIPGHAQAWGAMVKEINDDLASYTEILDVVAAIDAEPDFDPGYEYTKLWTEAYDGTNASQYYNFGSTDSYPVLPAGTPTPVVPPFVCCSQWTVDQLYHVSQGIDAALALPQIYTPQFSREWNRVKRWSIESGQPYELEFSGEMSECHSSPCGIGGDGTRYFNEEEAWRVFWLEINGDPDTRQYLTFSTDIRCSNGYHGRGCTPP